MEMPQRMTWPGHKMLDPTELEARFCIEDGLSFMDSIFTEPTREDKKQIAQIKGILDNIPLRESDFIDLYYFRRRKQTDIAEIFEVSQPTVCYRLKRAALRLKFILNLPKIQQEDLEQDLTGFLSDPLDVQIMILMWRTTCQSEVAKRLGVSQGLVRHRFERSVNRMRVVKKFKVYVRMYDLIAANLNILREVRRTAWGDQIVHRIS